jgi:aquaporin Z
MMKKNFSAYLMEASGLAGFVLLAGLLTIFLEHPDMPVMKSELQDYKMLRRIPLGIILGVYIAIVVLLFGKKSGAHINPSVTWTFYRLGKINFKQAIIYTIAQFAGAICAAQFLKYALGDLFSHPMINYSVTEPKPPHGTMTAFIAEFIISFILMLILLIASSSKKLEKKVPLITGILIAIYLIIEIPFSGMSLNPARSFGGALAANKWEHLWVYFVSPTLAMLAASEVFIMWKIKQFRNANSSAYANRTPIDYNEIPHYPVMKPA